MDPEFYHLPRLCFLLACRTLLLPRQNLTDIKRSIDKAVRDGVTVDDLLELRAGGKAFRAVSSPFLKRNEKQILWEMCSVHKTAARDGLL